MRKKVFVLVALLMATLCAKAQFWNGVELGGAVQYAHQRGLSNVGFDLTATKMVCEWSRLRAVIGVNGFVPNGLDRYGYGKVGATVDVLPFYTFAGFGLNCNPSAKGHVIGMAFDGGVGLHLAIARRCSLCTELGIDRINNGNRWQSTAAIKAGVMYCL